MNPTRTSRGSSAGIVLAVTVSVFSTGCAAATLPAGIAVNDLLHTQTSWAGSAAGYPDGPSEFTAAQIELPEGAETSVHCHPVPTLAYVVRGTLEVRTGDGRTQVFQAGEAFVEVMNTWHRGRAVAGPVELIVFYAGSPGIPNTLGAPDHAPSTDAAEPCATAHRSAPADS